MLKATRNLLTSLDPLSHRERGRRLAAWARTAPDRAAVCAELREQGPYERLLALRVAMVVRDRDGIVAATADPVPSIRAAALSAALHAGLPIGAHDDRPQVERRRIYRTLRRGHAPEVTDALIDEVRARFGDEEAAALLPGCGPETVRRLLPELEHEVEPARLVRRHAGVLLDRVGQRLAAATPEELPRIWAETGDAVLRCDPARVLDLLERYAPEDSLPGSLTGYGVLAAHDPHRVARLLTAPGRAAVLHRHRLPPAVLRRLTALSAGELAAIGTRVRDDGGPVAALLNALPPHRRGELYDRMMEDVDTATRLPAAAVMEVLPATVRIREATRVLALPRIREREADVALWSAYLDWPDASAALEPVLRSGDADERAAGYALLAAAARRSRDPGAVAEVVTRFARLRNEQDPVRASALGAMTGLAPLLTDETAAGLTRLTTDAVEARDGSAATMRALSTLAVHVLQHHVDSAELTEWALLTIDLVSSGATVPTLRRFDSVLRRGQETAVFARLRGWVENGIARGRYEPLLAVTAALGNRARNVPELQELLRRAAGPRTLPWVARSAIDLWLADPRTRSARVAEVLSGDASAVALHIVWATVCGVRTDLLDRALHRTVKGRFVEKGVRWVPGWAVHTERWLPRQQARFVELQAAIAADEGQDIQRRAIAIRTAAGVPAGGRDLVLRYLDHPEVAIAEAALGALARTDRPDEALPVLLAHAGGDRARVALYAAGRAARHVAPSRLEQVIGAVLTGPSKVTSRKEAARLLARYGPPGAMATLLGAYTAPDAHRDVRAAIVSAARQRLEAEESWTILRTAVGGSREERRAVLNTHPYLIPERHRRRYGGFVADAARADDREVRRAAFGQLGAWAPWLTGVTGLIVDRLTDLSESMVHMHAAQLLRAGGDATLGLALTRLVERDTADAHPADTAGGPQGDAAGGRWGDAAGGPGDAAGGPRADGPGDAGDQPDDAAGGQPADRAGDRPARRRVELLAHGAAIRSGTLPVSADRTALAEAARWLAAQPGYTGTALRLLVQLGRLDNLDEIADRCAGRPVLAARVADRAGARLRGLRAWTDLDLAGTVARLSARGDLAGGLFAVALVQHGAGFGWKEPWRELLLGLRRHPDADVREEAYGIDMGS